MKIVRFLGGLGNQMFQYAFYKYLETAFKETFVDVYSFENYALHNGLELEKIFNLELKKASRFTVQTYDPNERSWMYRKLRKFKGLKHAFQGETTDYEFNPAILKDQTSKLYFGYWQNLAYIEPVEKILKKDFQFKIPLDPENQQILNEILAANSVSVHVRRGDYVGHPLFDQICTPDYYQKAIEIISKEQSIQLFIFSNDIEWCKANLNLQHKNVKFINHNNGYKSYIDMQLMSNCKHHIIANSSFSWWGAWLNYNKDKIVVAPKKWINKEVDTSGLFPSRWITI